MKNKKSIDELATRIIQLEEKIQHFHQDENVKTYIHEIEKIMESLSPENLFELIKNIEKKNNNKN